MPRIGPQSAVIVRIPIPPALERLRRAHLGEIGSGIPAHVTVLYPFVAPDELDAGVRARLAEVASTMEPFTATFRAVGRFPDVLYLEPEPAAAFSALTDRVAAAWPDHPPYGGAFDAVIPHLTLIEAAAATQTPNAFVERWLPIERSVGALEVIVGDEARHWRRHWRIPLGRRIR